MKFHGENWYILFYLEKLAENALSNLYFTMDITHFISYFCPINVYKGRKYPSTGEMSAFRSLLIIWHSHELFNKDKIVQ